MKRSTHRNAPVDQGSKVTNWLDRNSDKAAKFALGGALLGATVIGGKMLNDATTEGARVAAQPDCEITVQSGDSRWGISHKLSEAGVPDMDEHSVMVVGRDGKVSVQEGLQIGQEVFAEDIPAKVCASIGGTALETAAIPNEQVRAKFEQNG